ncbi:hypothetical protein OCH239_01095 [Roseivivax halodurans JCM 10272]|uniref:Uncharacterized protein n=1 Tax=Roseivivax halodurans JCM 10272 TaxID=1449350 RepID=X7EK56_9RHOB|nr:DUF6477 family protein [Roseivivax halodurans]ETX16464.1 hypothetical protein OCH239_01095 [Roseivivax halodurans JCM 10272]
MQTLSQIVSGMRRPRLLVRAARIGSEGYTRSRHLPRLIGAQAAADPEEALTRLLETEEPLDAARRSGSAGYSPARHVELLSAIIAELEIARREQASEEIAPPPDHAKASGSASFLRAT